MILLIMNKYSIGVVTCVFTTKQSKFMNFIAINSFDVTPTYLKQKLINVLVLKHRRITDVN